MITRIDCLHELNCCSGNGRTFASSGEGAGKNIGKAESARMDGEPARTDSVGG